MEFRGFEMPPHARMSLAQQLLLRALIAWFWAKPYKRKLVRWGTRAARPLHAAAFHLAGFRDVIARSCATPASPSSPTGSRRISSSASRSIGSVTYDGIELELRQALEPWHVLGEEGAAGGTVRYVDSSVERLQVKVRGNLRHALS